MLHIKPLQSFELRNHPEFLSLLIVNILIFLLVDRVRGQIGANKSTNTHWGCQHHKRWALQCELLVVTARGSVSWVSYYCFLFLMGWFGSFLRRLYVNVSAFSSLLQGRVAKRACWCESGRDGENEIVSLAACGCSRCRGLAGKRQG